MELKNQRGYGMTDKSRKSALIKKAENAGMAVIMSVVMLFSGSIGSFAYAEDQEVHNLCEGKL